MVIEHHAFRSLTVMKDSFHFSLVWISDFVIFQLKKLD